MGVTVSFEFATKEEATAFLIKNCPTIPAEPEQFKPDALSSSAPPSKPEAVAEPTKRRGRSPKAQEAAPAPEPAAHSTVINAANLSPTEPSAQPDVSEADVQKALEKVFNEKGINTARDLLSRYGANRVAEMKREHYPKFVEHARKVLAGGEV